MRTYKDVYKLPLEMAEYGRWVYDANSNFVFQFEQHDKDVNKKFLDVINDVAFEHPTKHPFHHDNGYIKNRDGVDILLIRGWGNLTGTGGMNLQPEEAANIQDTFAEFIVNQLNGK